MAAYIPPKKGLDPTPQTGAPVVGDRRGGASPAGSSSDEAVTRASADLAAWQTAQRQNVANSILPFHHATFEHPDVSARYVNLNGVETLTVDPKPQDRVGDETEPVAEPRPPNDLVRLAEVERVTPDTPLFLMVLYEDSRIAAVPMSSLDKPSVFFADDLKGSRWRQFRRQILPTFQTVVGDTGVVLLPLDFTGQAGATHLYLSTTALGDAVETPSDVATIPILNGDAGTVYSNGASYRRQSGKLKLDKRAVGDGFEAVDPDGVCYYSARVQSYAPVQVGASGVNNGGDPNVLAAVAKLDAGHSSGGDSDNLDCYVAGILENQDDEHSNYNVTSLKTTRVIVTSKGAGSGGTSVQAHAFYGVAKMGDTPTVGFYTAATTSGGSGLSYNPGSNAFEFVGGGGGGSSDLSIALPLMNYGSGRLDVELFHIAASQSFEESTGTSGGNTACRFLGNNPSYSASYGGPGDSDPSVLTVIQGGIYASQNTDVAKPQNPINYAKVHDYFDKLITAMSLEADVVGIARKTCTPASVRYGSAGAAVLSSDKYNPADPANYYHITVIQGEENTAYSFLDLPTAPNHSTTRKIDASAHVGKADISYTSGDSDSSAIVVHYMPPMYEHEPSYTLIHNLSNGTVASTVYTPYGSFTSETGSDHPFQPWLHLNNKDHAIQAFYIDGDPHAFLDGRNEDWLPDLAKALDCKETDIVTMVMDVTLAKIKAVAGVLPPDYSSSGGAPIVPSN